ncbi:hypothetical protein BC940DRAFT_321534 [Gongronella butleri]|nr:hypothetical protein BC940DRAFT_321534 [Gongronella butleri]
MDAYRQSSLERVSLPAEIVIFILKLVPRKHLLQLRGSISRGWRDFITPIVFETLHLRNLSDPQNRGYQASTEEDYKAIDRRNELKTQTDFRETWLSSMADAATTRHCVRTVVIGGFYLHVSDVTSLLRRCPNVNSMVIDVSFLSTVNWRYDSDDRTHTMIADVPLSDHLYQQTLNDRLTDAIAPMFAATPKLDRLKVQGAIQAALLLSHLPFLRHLDLDSLVARHDTSRFVFYTGLDQIDVIQHHSPNLESLKVGGIDISKHLTAKFCQVWHRPGHDPSCIACGNPWPSVTCLRLAISRQTIPTDEIPALMAYICVKFPNLTHLDIATSGSVYPPLPSAAPINTSADSWRTMLDTSIAYLPNLVSCTFNVNPLAITALHHFTVAQHASRSTLTSLKIICNYLDGINMLDLLSMFHSLRSLHIHSIERLDQRARGDIAPVLESVDLPEPPIPYHPLRFLCLTVSVPLRVLITISKMCPDLTSASLTAGFVVHPLPSITAAGLPVEQLVEFGQKNRVYWLALPYSTRLKQLVIKSGKANAIFACTTPRMVEEGNDEQAENAALDDAADQDPSTTGSCRAWLVQRQGSSSKVKNVQSLKSHAAWFLDNLTFRTGQKKRQQDAGVTSNTISALNSARRTGIVAILLPSQPCIRLLQDGSLEYRVSDQMNKKFTLW